MKNILRAIMSLLLFVACTTTEESPSSVPNGGNESVTPSITLEQNFLNFDEHADVQTISFSSTMDWTAELINDRADGWCSISATSGTAGSKDIDVTVTENTSTDDRTASVIIKSGAISKTVRISQKQRDALTVTSSTFEIEGTSGKIYIEVKANVDFEYTINGSAAEWISPIETRALKTTKLGFNIAENKTMQRREGTITIHSGEFSETVTVYQKDGGDAILLSQKEYVVSNEGEEISIDVTSSVDVELEMPDVDWITRNTSRAVSTNTYYFTIAENTTPDQREAYITFKNTEKNISERVKVTQIQKDAIVLAQSIYNIDKEGGALDFDIQTNVEITVSISEDAQSWITQVETRGLHTETLHFDIAPYDGDATREGSITISGGNATQTITIYQREIVILDTPNYNEIYYTTNDRKTITPNMANWDDTIISNIYNTELGYGIITFDNNITSIGRTTFWDCSSLTSIIIPEGVTSIGDHAFYGCSSLTSITIPESVTSIGNFAFSGCSSLAEITIGNGVTSIGDSAFSNCSSFTSITIPEGVTSIGSSAFSGCSSLTSIIIPDNVTAIGNSVFGKCSNLTSFYGKFATDDNRCIILDGELKAFAPAGLTTYNIPESVTSIGNFTFSGCSSLTSITIPEGVTSIGDSAFSNCSSFTSITIPEGVTSIGSSAFSGCSKLTSITIPDNVTLIERQTFCGCSALTSITIPDGVTSIGEDAFHSCNSLANITIPNSVISIGKKAFGWCSALENITIPNSVIEIGNLAFDLCIALKNVYCKATTPPAMGTDVFNGNADDIKIHVPAFAVDAYRTAAGWSDYADAIQGYDF